MAPERIRF